ncbi:PIN domain-containing protein [Spirosoma sp. KCTC 42546]|uniref:type II toxin-antitoxin system VapC family toxin n=1 Tax=Spirosoma sp. KCTC 42546 TaxID=2520506 RepID=UPI001159B977|nr:PIN domain-containing protein [Spirosoma sp. KCTC 42546]QDK78169.1 PIN domain-containing protein [Spirosoma sp. KCTC 42546]
MIYFDTDVLVHYFVAYAPVQHQQSKVIVGQAMTDGQFYVSQLSMQELAHTMGKFNQPAPLVEEAMNILRSISPVNYNLSHFERAMQLATRTGFSSINDCLHTALAESQGCAEIITYNRKQFDIIKSLTTLKVTILKVDEVELK